MEAQIATAGQRIRASIVDGGFLLPLFLLDNAVPSLTQTQWILFLYFLLSFQVGWLYTTLLHGWRGQTLGKMLLRIAVVRATDSGKLGFKRAALRDSPYIVLITAYTGIWIYAHVAWFGGWYADNHRILLERAFALLLYTNVGWALLELVTMVFHPQRRAIHDLIAGTIVTRGTTAT